MKRISVVGLVVMVLFVAAVPASAQGVSATPGFIEVDDALRGSTIFRQVTFSNDAAAGQPFEISFRGDAAAWLAVVDPDDETTVVTEVTDPDGNGVIALLRIQIPADVPVGEYDAQVVARLAPPENDEGEGQSGVDVGLGIIVPLRLNVTGDEIVAASVQDVFLSDTEVGIPARMTIAISNDGNTQINPEFTLEILTGGSVVSSVTSSNTPSFPGEQKTFEVRWDTSTVEPGEYTARLTTVFGELDLGTEERVFNVLPAGSFSRVLVLDSLELSGEPRAGGLTGFTATIQNPGQADTSGTLVGELLTGGSVVSTYESPPFLVAGRETLPVPINIETPDQAEYEFRVKVVYGDSETETQSITFTTAAAGEAAAGASDDSGSSIPIAAIAVGIAVLILIGLAIWFFARTRANGTAPPAAEEEDPETATVTSDT